MPGGMGVNLVKQYRQAGLSKIPFLSAFTVDETTLPAQQDAALGFLGDDVTRLALGGDEKDRAAICDAVADLLVSFF